MELLTEKQHATLDFIRAYIREHGLAPTIQEIAAGMGWKSPNAAQSHVNALVRKGRLKIKRGANRGIILIGAHNDREIVAQNASAAIIEIMRAAFREGWDDEHVKASILAQVNRVIADVEN